MKGGGREGGEETFRSVSCQMVTLSLEPVRVIRIEFLLTMLHLNDTLRSRIKERRSSCLLEKFSLSAPEKMYSEQYGE